MSATETVRLTLVSSVPGLVVGDDALVEVTSAGPSAPSLQLNGAPVGVAITRDPATGNWRALVTGLAEGENRLEAVADGLRAELTVRAYPVQGPVISGPHLHPWALTTEENGLGPALDEHGNAPARVSYQYMSASSGDFTAYDPASPPADGEIATTTTDAGVTVPYVVRHERGAANRGIYELAVLCDPHQPWTALAPQPGWNGKLWIPLYGGWNQRWSQTVPGASLPGMPRSSVLIDMGLRRGFMIARTTQIQSMTNSDSVRGAESLIMLKQHVTKHYGRIRYTLGTGASGGSIMQQMIANQYPGIFQGIIPMSSLPSSWYLPTVLNDSRLLEHHFTVTSPQLWQNEADRLAVDGHSSENTRQFFNTVFTGRRSGNFDTGGQDPVTGTGLDDAQAYHPDRNPGGARATLQDYQVNYLGRRPEAEWTDAERAAGHGFAQLPWDNAGVQYGLAALLDGRITPEQFTDLNEKIGGVDIDNHIVPARNTASADAVALLHRGGFINDFANMDQAAIIDIRPPEQGDLPSHTQFHTWIVRDGLTAAHGHARNHVAWMIPGPPVAITPPEAVLLTMDRWLAAIEADHSDKPLPEKIAAARPEDASDGIRTPEGEPAGDLADYHRLYPSYGDARTVAACGDPRSQRIAKPQLKPLRPADYPGIEFTTEQWQRLQTTFPDGVADWTKPGVSQTSTIPWLSYANGPGGEPVQHP
ncbi:MAG TPA: DUF6351 family protein [Trebonia sp.]